MDLLFRFMQQDIYANEVRQKEKGRNSARLQGLETCIKCGHCCYKRTCVPRPDEMQRIADFLGLTVLGLIQQHMVADERDGHYFWRFANTAQRDILGEFLPANRTFDLGDCIFFHVGCDIYPVRPEDAVLTTCWNGGGEHSEPWKAWKEGDAEKFCPNVELD